MSFTYDYPCSCLPGNFFKLPKAFQTDTHIIIFSILYNIPQQDVLIAAQIHKALGGKSPHPDAQISFQIFQQLDRIDIGLKLCLCTADTQIHISDPEVLCIAADFCFVFFMENIARFCLYLYSGILTWESAKFAVVLLPACILGLAVGILAAKKIPEKHAKKVVSILLVLTGLSLTLQNIGVLFPNTADMVGVSFVFTK